MQYILMNIRLNELTSKQISVPAWEVPVVEAIYGDAAQQVDFEVVSDRPVPDARDEFARLAQKYDRQLEVDNATVSKVYGTHQKGIAELAKAIKQASGDEGEGEAGPKDLKGRQMKALQERQKAEKKALEERQKEEAETAEREFDKREEDRARREEDEKRRDEEEAQRIADINSRMVEKVKSATAGKPSHSAMATRAGGEAPGGGLSVGTVLPNSGVSGGTPNRSARGDAPGNGPSGTGASPGTKKLPDEGGGAQGKK
jgi:hypothetical protein